MLILSDVGMSHSLTAEITKQIVAGVRETPERHIEFYFESLDLARLRVARRRASPPSTLRPSAITRSA